IATPERSSCRPGRRWRRRTQVRLNAVRCSLTQLVLAAPCAAYRSSVRPFEPRDDAHRCPPCPSSPGGDLSRDQYHHGTLTDRVALLIRQALFCARLRDVVGRIARRIDDTEPAAVR